MSGIVAMVVPSTLWRGAVGWTPAGSRRRPLHPTPSGVSMRSRLMLVPFAVLLACGGSDSTSPGTTGGNNNGGGGPVATTAVQMKSFAFTPASIKVAPGATVTWTNGDATQHNVTFDGGAVAASGTVAGGANKALVMPSTAGT